MVSKDINFKTTYKKLKIRKNAIFHKNRQKSTILGENRDLGPPGSRLSFENGQK